MDHCILDSKTFKRVMWFKLFMVLFPWALIPLFIPVAWLPSLGIHFTLFQVMLLRLWGIVVLTVFFLYLHIYLRPHSKLSRFFMLFGMCDNGGLGILFAVGTIIYKLPLIIAINSPILLFFGYWFAVFRKRGKF